MCITRKSCAPWAQVRRRWCPWRTGCSASRSPLEPPSAPVVDDHVDVCSPILTGVETEIIGAAVRLPHAAEDMFALGKLMLGGKAVSHRLGIVEIHQRLQRGLAGEAYQTHPARRDIVAPCFGHLRVGIEWKG